MWITITLFSISGRNPNPNWDQNDPANAQVAATLFGVHLFVNIAFSLIVFLLVKIATKGFRQSLHVRSDVRFQKLPVCASEEQEALLEDSL